MKNTNILQNKKIIKSLRDNDIVFAALFGSRAKGKAKKTSDYDFLVEFSPNKRYTLFDLAGLKLSLEKLLNNEVDLVTMPGMNKRIKNEVLKNMQVVYDDRKR